MEKCVSGSLCFFGGLECARATRSARNWLFIVFPHPTIATKQPPLYPSHPLPSFDHLFLVMGMRGMAISRAQSTVHSLYLSVDASHLNRIIHGRYVYQYGNRNCNKCGVPVTGFPLPLSRPVNHPVSQSVTVPQCYVYIQPLTIAVIIITIIIIIVSRAPAKLVKLRASQAKPFI